MDRPAKILQQATETTILWEQVARQWLYQLGFWPTHAKLSADFEWRHRVMRFASHVASGLIAECERNVTAFAIETGVTNRQGDKIVCDSDNSVFVSKTRLLRLLSTTLNFAGEISVKFKLRWRRP